jgi:hypothetical protein
MTRLASSNLSINDVTDETEKLEDPEKMRNTSEMTDGIMDLNNLGKN